MSTRLVDMLSDDYHSHPALSRSALWKFKQLPQKYWYEYLSGEYKRPEDTPSLVTGSVVHTMILEPDTFNSLYYVMPKVNRATKVGKQAYEDALVEAGGRTLINEQDYALAQSMHDSVYSNEVANAILTNAQVEKSIFWTDPVTGLELKARPDVINGSIVADVKTTLEAGRRSFQTSAYNFGYYLQAAMICDAMEFVGQEIDQFVFICVEKSAPYSTALYMPDDEAIDFGRKQLRKLLDDYQRCLDKNEWPDYGIQSLTIPNYAALEQQYEQSE